MLFVQVLYMNGWVLWHNARSFVNAKRGANLCWYPNFTEMLVDENPAVYKAENALEAWVGDPSSWNIGAFWTYINSAPSADGKKQNVQTLVGELKKLYKGFV